MRRQCGKEIVEFAVLRFDVEIHVVTVAQEIKFTLELHWQSVDFEIILFKNKRQGIGVDFGNQIGVDFLVF